MIDIVTPRGGKTHVRTGMNADTWDTLCGRKVVGYQGYTEEFTGDDICKLCAKAFPAAQAETEAVLADLKHALDDAPYLPAVAPEGGVSVMNEVIAEALVPVAYRVAVGWARLISDGRKRHGMVQHARSKRRAAMKKLLASL